MNKRSAYIERPTPPLVEEDAPFGNRYLSRKEHKPWSLISTRPEAKSDCAVEDQQEFSLPTDRPEDDTERLVKGWTTRIRLPAGARDMPLLHSV
jgi:hypothetical protein